MAEVELFEYDGYLSLNISPEQAAAITQRARGKGLLGVEVSSRSLVFKYIGRDQNRRVTDYLRQLAKDIGDADGEIVCTLTNDDGDPSFEFYTISAGRLICQLGSIVRQPEQDVTDKHRDT